MIADELRALADKADALVQQNAERRECSVYLDMAMESIEGLAPVLRALADKLQDKVVVRPTMRRYDSSDPGEPFIAELWDRHTTIGATEVEAIANLQAALDRSEG